jgi:hypothetical protein
VSGCDAGRASVEHGKEELVFLAVELDAMVNIIRLRRVLTVDSMRTRLSGSRGIVEMSARQQLVEAGRTPQAARRRGRYGSLRRGRGHRLARQRLIKSRVVQRLWGAREPTSPRRIVVVLSAR